MRNETSHGKRVLVVDNYDSFTYNLVQYLGELGCDPIVFRNDKLSPRQIEAIVPDRIVISPGPGVPAEAGRSCEIIETFASSIPILGICLGHQAIAEVFGGEVVRVPKLVHGKTSMIRHNGSGLFRDLDNPFEATRYHSLIVQRDSLPEAIEITAETEDSLVMGIRVTGLQVHGVQFHPESIMTPQGKKLLENFICCSN